MSVQDGRRTRWNLREGLRPVLQLSNNKSPHTLTARIWIGLDVLVRYPPVPLARLPTTLTLGSAVPLVADFAVALTVVFAVPLAVEVLSRM